ncbi:hypothetical protein [Streptomyces afghaniensis]|nr:hypothetical protein [Streptomyces afghaniensis]MDQ1022356.1 hypothetical protein [Streptomyces afghaniensis]
MTFKAEKAISPTDGSVRRVIVDESYTIHTEDLRGGHPVRGPGG